MSKPKTYAEKLRDPRWQKLRLEIMNRDGFKCGYCHDKTTTLTVHHAHYIKGCEPWEYGPELLITVCEDCHAKIESAKDSIMELSAKDPAAFVALAGLAQSKEHILLGALSAFINPTAENACNLASIILSRVK
jgi:hypothetical protein